MRIRCASKEQRIITDNVDQTWKALGTDKNLIERVRGEHVDFMRPSDAQALVNIEFRFESIEREKIVHNAESLLELIETGGFNVFKKLGLTNKKNMQELFPRGFHI